MLEVEMKFAVEDLTSLEARLLRDFAAEQVSQVHEADHYFNAPDRDFALTDEALRVRRIGNFSWITYKGPRQATTTKTRVEIEVPLQEGEQHAQDILELFSNLGYRPVGVVRKTRRTFRLTRSDLEVRVCLDQVDQVGSFAEIEIVVHQPDLEKAQQIVLDLARRIGLSEMERRSYLKLLLLSREKTG